MRQIILDTETTGLDPKQGHRIIEIGCVELIDRRLTGNHYHQYVNPDRAIDKGALAVHGISNEFLADKPKFKDIIEEFIRYIDDAELIIHNAPFDIGFLNNEIKLQKKIQGRIDHYCKITDTLTMARKLYPGQRNSLDALCKRYGIDNSHRDLHGALLDSEILARVYLAMTGGQISLFGEEDDNVTHATTASTIRRLSENRKPTPIIHANKEELRAHNDYLENLTRE